MLRHTKAPCKNGKPTSILSPVRQIWRNDVSKRFDSVLKFPVGRHVSRRLVSRGSRSHSVAAFMVVDFCVAIEQDRRVHVLQSVLGLPLPASMFPFTIHHADNSSNAGYASRNLRPSKLHGEESDHSGDPTAGRSRPANHLLVHVAAVRRHRRVNTLAMYLAWYVIMIAWIRTL